MARSAVMLRQACRLIPFERSISPKVQISAELVWRREGWLELSYGVLVRAAKGIDVLKLPAGLNDGPQQGQRTDELWTTTCFEAFISAPGKQRYWEVNLAATTLSTSPQLLSFGRRAQLGRRWRPGAQLAAEWRPGVCRRLFACAHGALSAVVTFFSIFVSSEPAHAFPPRETSTSRYLEISVSVEQRVF